MHGSVRGFKTRAFAPRRQASGDPAAHGANDQVSDDATSRERSPSPGIEVADDMFTSLSPAWFNQTAVRPF